MFDAKKFHYKVDLCCKQKGITITQMLKELGMSTSFGTNWKNGRTPTAIVVKGVANYLGVSTDYLLADDADTIPLIRYAQNENEFLLLKFYRELTEEDQYKMLCQIKDSFA